MAGRRVRREKQSLSVGLLQAFSRPEGYSVMKLLKAAKASGKSQVTNNPTPKFHIFKHNSKAVFTCLFLPQVIKLRPSNTFIYN